MMKLDDIKKALKDRRVSVVAKATGIHFNTIRDIRDKDSANPTYNIVTKLSDYLSKENG